jgi:hypothetical protein
MSTILHHRFKIPTYKTQKGCMGKDVGPTRGFVASPEVGPGATVGTLRTGYPRVQAPSQDKRQGGRACPCVPRPRLPPLGSSGAAACPRNSGSRLPARGRSGATTCPCGSSFHLLVRGGSRAATCCLGSSTHLLAQGSSGAATCPEDGLYKLQAIKQISPGDPIIMIFIGAHARISFKALCNKGCSAHLQGVQQATH